MVEDSNSLGGGFEPPEEALDVSDDDPDFEAALPPPDEVPDWPASRRKLSETQQDRFRDYLDEEIMRITRKYIQRLNNPVQGYRSFADMLHDINKLVDLLWYSVTSTYSEGGDFQSYYLLRIADDLVDYIEGYQNEPCPEDTIRILQKLDAMLSQLVDGHGPVRLTRTEAVRLQSIAERTRIVVASIIKGLELEVAKVYENVLDKTS
jgi:hypothetical protein